MDYLLIKGGPGSGRFEKGSTLNSTNIPTNNITLKNGSISVKGVIGERITAIAGDKKGREAMLYQQKVTGGANGEEFLVTNGDVKYWADGIEVLSNGKLALVDAKYTMNETSSPFVPIKNKVPEFIRKKIVGYVKKEPPPPKGNGLAWEMYRAAEITKAYPDQFDNKVIIKSNTRAAEPLFKKLLGNHGVECDFQFIPANVNITNPQKFPYSQEVKTSYLIKSNLFPDIKKTTRLLYYENTKNRRKYLFRSIGDPIFDEWLKNVEPNILVPFEYRIGYNTYFHILGAFEYTDSELEKIYNL